MIPGHSIYCSKNILRAACGLQQEERGPEIRPKPSTQADLRQTFMPAFVAGAVEGDTKSMMTSYHALNGIPASASPVIRSELREALGWEGMMMSDGGAISYMLNFKSNEAMKNLSMLHALQVVVQAEYLYSCCTLICPLAADLK